MSAESDLSSRRFTHNDQISFAQMSGDWNPIHVDPIAARRTAAGAPVVHGMHLLLWAIESAASELAPSSHCVSIRARFLNWTYVGNSVHAHIGPRSDARLRVTLDSNGVRVMSADLTLNSSPNRVASSQSSSIVEDPSTVPLTLEFSEMKGRTGTVILTPSAEALSESFAKARAFLGEAPFIGLLGTTKLVGMICPGMHSIFSGITADLVPDVSPAGRIDYKVARTDERFRSLTIDVSGSGISGTIEAFARVPPIGQEPIAQVAQVVGREEFSGTRALIVGGSRGLGEFSAKAIAAGGGRVTITYATGFSDAERIATEIKESKGTCECIPYDVQRPAEAQLSKLTYAPTAILYFATCPIFQPHRKGFDTALFERFIQFYVQGFFEVCRAHQSVFASPASVFYPSSVFVDETPRGMTEYAMAKSAGEILCRQLTKDLTNLRIVALRLPRVATDQTTSLIQAQQSDVAEVMLPILRRVCGLTLNRD